MWYTTTGILLATVVLFYATLAMIQSLFRKITIYPGRDRIIPFLLSLTVALYFGAVKDNNDVKDAAKRGALTGGIVYALLLFFPIILTLLGFGDVNFEMVRMFIRILSEGALLSAAAAAVSVAIQNRIK
jgi:hypothetical protein